MNAHSQRPILSKLWRKIVPLVAGVLFLSFLNKVGMGFAALQMNNDLGFSNTVFGAGAGCFAIGYALFGIPSTLLLHRLGARRWLGVTLTVWMVCAVATAFVTRPGELLGVRLLLGMAEAAFSPGIILYLTYWFPSEYRGRVLSAFWFLNPLALAIGAPLSSALLSWDGWLELNGWQWLFIVESLPALPLAVAVFWLLTDRPAQANWLAPEEKAWLADRLAREQPRVEAAAEKISIWRTLANKKLWMLGTVYLTIGTGGVGIVFFLPLIIESMGFSVWTTGFVAALPAIAAAVSLPLWGIWTDYTSNREAVLATACCMSGLGLLATAALLPSAWAMVPICIAMIGLFGSLVAFWPLPAAFLTGASAAAGFALINIIGNVGTFFGPSLLGWMSDRTQSYAAGLVCLAAISAAAAILMAAQAARNRTLSAYLPQPLPE